MSKTHPKNHHPATKNKGYPVGHKKPQNHHKSTNLTQQFFRGNLVADMRFDNKDHELSGYVQRVLIVKDRYGNQQIAKEKQFFNSAKNIGEVRIHDDKRKKY